jgi:hypothetical protein
MKSMTLDDYLMGRDRLYPDDYTPDIADNAMHMLQVVNNVIAQMLQDGVEPVAVASGWRPRAVNDGTANAAEHSRHITAEACDLRDTEDRALAQWAVLHQDILKACGVMACENPGWTPTWLHIQIVPVASGRFFFIPSSAPPSADRMGM